MRYTSLFGQTWRNSPNEEGSSGHRLLLRAAFYRRLSGGDLALLPLGHVVLERLQAELVRGIAPEVSFFALDLSGGPEEPLAEALDLARREITSYRQLPLFLPLHAGDRCLRFLLLTSDREACDARLADLKDRLERALASSAQVPLLLLERPDGFQFGMPHVEGPVPALVCPTCAYAAPLDLARCVVSSGSATKGALSSPTLVSTPDCPTIESLAKFLGIPPDQTIKTLMYVREDTGQFLFALIRGDLELSLAKLRLAVGADVRPATVEEIRAAGAVPGYASPLGLDHPVFVDASIELEGSYVTGANREGYHWRDVVPARDLVLTWVGDLVQCREGSSCPQCQAELGLQAVFPLALLRRWPEIPDLTYLAADGRPRPIAVGVVEVNLLKVMEAVATYHHDEHGLCWPPQLAPADIHLVGLDLHRDEGLRAQAESLYTDLLQDGWRVLFDDRDERPGVKFNDADLIGCPIRLTLGRRSLEQGGVELLRRATGQRQIVPVEQLSDTLSAL